MSFYFSICASEACRQKYLDFLLEHYDELRMPYSFPVTFGFVASPVLIEGEAFLCFNGEEEVIGAFGYIYGTGDREYEDKEIVQVQIVFIRKEYRGTLLFIRALQFMTQRMSGLPFGVEELRFWTPVDEGLRRLFGKISAKTASRETMFGEIDECSVSFPDLYAFAKSSRHETSCAAAR